MKAWITKYALTEGIFEAEGEINYGTMFRYKNNGWNVSAHGEGKDWHLTKEAAVARAEAMRLAKIKSLEKSIKKMQSLKFE